MCFGKGQTIFLKLKTSCVILFLTETYLEIVIALTNKLFLVMFERLTGYLMNIWTTGGFDCQWNIQEWSRSATTDAGHFLLHLNNLMLSVKLCEYYLLNVSFSIGEIDDRCSLQNLQWEKYWRNGYYMCRTCWPIYGLHDI